MNIKALLNSGELHRSEGVRKPECVDILGNVHATPERAFFVSWRIRMTRLYGDIVTEWPQCVRDEYRAKYVPSH